MPLHITTALRGEAETGRKLEKVLCCLLRCRVFPLYIIFPFYYMYASGSKTLAQCRVTD